MKKTFLISVLVACLFLGISCRNKGSGQSKKLSVFVSVGPQAYIVRNIAGDLVDVHVLVGPGAQPHTFEPTPKQLAELSDASIYFRIGIPFENQLVKKLSDYKGLEIVNVAPTENLIEIEHKHGDHTHNELDPHTWMSPKLIEKQADAVLKELIRIDPANSEIYTKNTANLKVRLEILHEELSKSLAPVKGKTFFVFHPAFGYFAKEYGLIQKAVETGGKSPSLKHVNELIENAKTQNVKVIFVQPQFSKKAAQSIADAIGGKVVPIDPLSEDYENNMRKIADLVRSS